MSTDSQPPETPNVNVMLLISGGHQCELSLPPDAPLLRDIFEVLMNRSQNQGSSRLFQIPVDEGRSSLYIPSDSIMGIATEPPLRLPGMGSTIKPSPVVQQPSTNFWESKYLQFDNFLSPEEHSRLLDYVVEKEPNFVPSSVSSGDPDYRRSMILHYFHEFSKLMIDRVQGILPEVLNEFRVPWFLISEIECQLTAHNDGHFYKAHNDNGDALTSRRVFSYVYYFYREPKAFTGGELRMFDSKLENNFYVAADSFKTIEPRNNSIVFFSSNYMHEVMPVICPSKAFADSRFTINGWVRR